MRSQNIPSAAAFARQTGLSESTARDLIAGRYDPKRKKIVAKLEKLLGGEAAAAEPSLVISKKAASRSKLAPPPEVLVAAGKIPEISIFLYWLVFVADEETRWQLRELLGSKFNEFLSLTRALTNERMRDKVIEEEGESLQKGRSNGGNHG